MRHIIQHPEIVQLHKEARKTKAGGGGERGL
jgi:hypothetical protein